MLLSEYSKSSHIRTYFFWSQAEKGSYLKGTKINFKVQRFLFEGTSDKKLRTNNFWTLVRKISEKETFGQTRHQKPRMIPGYMLN